MNTNNTTVYDLLQLGFGSFTSASFQEFVDALPDRYNKLDVEGFAFGSLKTDYEFAQLITSLNIVTLPTYVDPDAPAYERSLGKFEINKEQIPTQKSRYAFDKRVLADRLKLISEVGKAGLTSRTRDVILNLFFDSVTKLQQSFANSLTHQRDKIVSNLKFEISKANNARGLKGITIDFNIPKGNATALTGDELWWTDAEHVTANEGANADPIEVMKTWRREIERKTLRTGQFHFEMTKDLYQDLLLNKKVLQRVGYRVYSVASTDAQALNLAENMDLNQVGTTLEALVGAPIVQRDTMAMQEVFDTKEKNIVPQAVENFNPKNIALVPNGALGDIQGVNLAMLITPFLDGNSTLATALNGMLALTTEVNTRSRSMIVDGEMAALCVPSQPQYMFVKTVTA